MHPRNWPTGPKTFQGDIFALQNSVLGLVLSDEMQGFLVVAGGYYEMCLPFADEILQRDVVVGGTVVVSRVVPLDFFYD